MTHRRRHRHTSRGTLAVLGSTAFARAQLAPVAGSVVPGGGGVRFHSRFRHGNCFQGRNGHSPWVRSTGCFVVFQRLAGLPHGDKARHPGTPQLGDSQLRVERGSRDVAILSTLDHFFAALVVPAIVHCGRVAVLGSQPSGRGMVDTAAVRVKKSCQDFEYRNRITP